MNWEQLRTVLWLRGRITRNQWRKQGGLGPIIAGLLLGAAFLIGFGAFGGGLLGGAALGDAPPDVINLVCLGVSFVFLMFWMVGLLVELQRSESIDLQKVMHLPVQLGQIFVINYIASHFTLSLVVAVPAMMGLAIGLAWERGAVMLWMVPLWLAAVGMVTAWTYCLRGWLGALMSNPRKRRTALVTITLLFIAFFQLPNLYFNVFRRWGEPRSGAAAHHERRAPKAPGDDLAIFDGLEQAEAFVPPLWPAVGAEALARDRLQPPLLALAGCLLLGAWGLLRAYRGTVRFYRGDGSTAGAVAPRTGREAVSSRPARAWLIEARVPGLPEQASAVAVATWRSMLRAPEVKIVLGSVLVVTFVMGSMLLLRVGPLVPEQFKPFAVLGALAFSTFLAIQFLTNQYGLDREGIRTLVLSPVPRRHIVLGKSVASLVVAALFGVVLLVASVVGLRLPLSSVVAVVFQWATVLFVVSIAGTALSILFPLRVAAGSMKPTKTTGVNMVIVVFFQLLFPLVMLPAFAPGLVELVADMMGYSHGRILNVLLSAVFAAAAAAAYSGAMGGLGRLFQRREMQIVAAVTTEVE